MLLELHAALVKVLVVDLVNHRFLNSVEHDLLESFDVFSEVYLCVLEVLGDNFTKDEEKLIGVGVEAIFNEHRLASVACAHTHGHLLTDGGVRLELSLGLNLARHRHLSSERLEPKAVLLLRWSWALWELLISWRDWG